MTRLHCIRGLMVAVIAVGSLSTLRVESALISLSQVMQDGMSTPAGAVGPVGSLGVPTMFDANHVLSANYGDNIYYAGDGQVVSVVAQAGQTLPFTVPSTYGFAYSDTIEIGDYGVAYAVHGTTTAMPKGLFYWDGVSNHRVIQSGMADPTNPGYYFSYVPVHYPAGADSTSQSLSFFASATNSVGAVKGGVYRYSTASHTLSQIVDYNTPVPDAPTKTFQFIEAEAESGGNRVAFIAQYDEPGSYKQGIYAVDGSDPVAVKVASGSAMPGSAYTFKQFSDLNGRDGSLLFKGSSASIGSSLESGFTGIYLLQGSTLTKIADENTTAPGGTGSFSEFLSWSVEGQTVVFVAKDGNGVIGLYTNLGGTSVTDFSKVVAVGESLNGRVVNAIYMGHQGISSFSSSGHIGVKIAYAGGAGVFLSGFHRAVTPTAPAVNWDTSSTWADNTAPADTDVVSFAPSTATTLVGPAADTTVGHVTVGGGSGQAVLQLQSGATLTVLDELHVASNGKLTGSGIIEGNVRVEGIHAAGNSPGHEQIIGNLIHTASSLLEVELGGLIQGVTYDWYEVTGNASLSGDLSVILWNGYLPQASDVFTFLTAGGELTGGFLNLGAGNRVTTLDGQHSFLVSFDTVNDWIRLSDFSNSPASAVPEPTTAVLWLVGGVVLFRYGRRTKLSEVSGQKSSAFAPKLPPTPKLRRDTTARHGGRESVENEGLTNV